MASVHEAIDALVEGLGLRPDDHDALKTKRGFSDALIRHLKFSSASPDAGKVVAQVREKVGDEVCLEAGILVERHGRTTPEVHQDLLERNIVIPFRRAGRWYYWQTHKKALSSDIADIQPYLPRESLAGSIPVVITESAFKAAAAYQFGFPSVGLPGISSFAGRHFDRLARILYEEGASDLVVIFDNEVKDGSEGDRIVEDPMRRYDTQYYAFVLAYRLSKYSKHDEDEEVESELAFSRVRIGTLPDEWRVEGKVDIDSALAQGRTAKEFELVVASARSPSRFIEIEKEKGNEPERVLGRKIDEYFFRARAAVREDRNAASYYVFRTSKANGNTYREYISDFVIRIRNRYETPDGCVREAIMLNRRGDKSDPFMIDPNEMASLMAFKTACYSRGDFTWTGSTHQMQEVFQLELLRRDGRVIRQPDHVGWVEDAGGWLFGNCLIKPGGEVIEPDDNGVIWQGDEGWAAIPLASGEAGERGIPEIYLGDERPDFAEVTDQLVANWSDYHALKLCVGWVCACLASHWIFKEFRAFPLLFIEGKARSGKTTLSRWLSLMAGINESGDHIEEATNVGVSRNVAYLSSLPYELVEYRNNRKVKDKAGLMRVIWDRQGTSKGVRAEFGTRRAMVRSGMIVNGQDAPVDHALLTRFVMINLKKMDIVKGGGTYRSMNRIGRKLSSLVRLVAERVEDPEVFIEHCRQMVSWLEEKGTDDERTAINYGIAAAGYDFFIRGQGNPDAAFLKWLTEETKMTFEEREEEDLLPTFISDLDELWRKGKINHAVIHRGVRDKEHIWIHLPSAFSAWQEFNRQRGREEEWSKRALLGYLREEPWFEGHGSHVFGDKKTRCALKCRFDDAPIELQQLAMDDDELDGNEDNGASP